MSSERCLAVYRVNDNFYARVKCSASARMSWAIYFVSSGAVKRPSVNSWNTNVRYFASKGRLLPLCVRLLFQLILPMACLCYSKFWMSSPAMPDFGSLMRRNSRIFQSLQRNCSKRKKGEPHTPCWLCRVIRKIRKANKVGNIAKRGQRDGGALPNGLLSLLWGLLRSRLGHERNCCSKSPLSTLLPFLPQTIRPEKELYGWR